MFIEGAFYLAEAITKPTDYINPITMTLNAADKAYTYLNKKEEKLPSALPQKKIDKFKKLEKEDFYRDDPYKEMWDKDWIYK